MYRVLLVDDEIMNYQLFEKLVNWDQCGFQIVGTAGNGVDALKKYEELHPDVIFMDIQLPLMDGLECIRCIRQENRKIRIVIVSAYGDFTYAQKAIRYGVQDFLLKPVSRIVLNQLVEKLKQELDIQGKEGEKDIYASEEVQCLRRICEKQEPLTPEQKEFLGSREFAGITVEDDGGNYLTGGQARGTYDRMLEEGIPEGISGIWLRPEGKALLCWAEGEPSACDIENISKWGKAAGVCIRVYPCFCGSKDRRTWLKKFLECENYGFYDEEGGIYDLDEVPFSEGEIQMIQTDALVSAAVTEHSHKEVMEQTRRLFNTAEQEKTDPRIVKEMAVDYLVRIKFALKKLDQKESFNMLRNVRLETIYGIQNFGKLYRYLEKKLEDTFGELERQDRHQGRSIVFQANAFAKLHYCESSFSVQRVADHIGISKNYFTSMYKEQAGIGFWEFVTRLRMDKARECLITTEETAGNIGRMVGYESEFHFSRKFKEYMGEAPNKFRRNKKESSE